MLLFIAIKDEHQKQSFADRKAPVLDAPTRFFPMNIAKILRTAFFIEHLQWLFLNIYIIF